MLLNGVMMTLFIKRGSTVFKEDHILKEETYSALNG